LDLVDVRGSEVVLEGEMRGDGLSLREGQAEALGHEVDQLTLIRRDGRAEQARNDVLRLGGREAHHPARPVALATDRPVRAPARAPPPMPARPRARAAAAATARPPGAGRHARALLVGIAPALFARGLDLR